MKKLTERTILGIYIAGIILAGWYDVGHIVARWRDDTLTTMQVLKHPKEVLLFRKIKH